MGTSSTPVTGIPSMSGAALVAQCSPPLAGSTVLAGDVQTGEQSIENDIATISAGNYSTSATVACSGAWTFNGFCTFNGLVQCSDVVEFTGSCKVTWDIGATCVSHIPLANANASIPVQGISFTTPALICIGFASLASLADGASVVYSGNGTGGEQGFVANLTSYQYVGVGWSTATAYDSPSDGMAGAGPNNRCIVSHGGSVWVCESSGTSTNPPTGSLGSTFTDNGGAPVWRNIGTDGNQVIGLVGSVGDSGSTGGSATLTVPAQVKLNPSRVSTRVLTRWSQDGPIIDATLGNQFATIGAADPVAFWNRSANSGFGRGFGNMTAIATTAYVTTAPQPQTCFWTIASDEVPDGALLTQVSVTFQPGNGHSVVPTNRPTVQILRTFLSTGTTEVIGQATLSGSAVANVTNYEQIHTLNVSVTANEPYDPYSNPSPYVQPWEVVSHKHFRYDVMFQCEYTTNALAGTVVFGARAISTVTFPQQV